MYKLYHGTIYDFICVDLSKSLDKKDFGKGFYTTRDVNTAKQWASRHSRNGYYIYCIEVDIQFIRDHFIVKEFRHGRDWLDYIIKNRINPSKDIDCDLVIGPIADARTQIELEKLNREYGNNIPLEVKDKVIKKLRETDYGIQYCFKSDRIAQYINTQCKWTRRAFR